MLEDSLQNKHHIEGGCRCSEDYIASYYYYYIRYTNIIASYFLSQKQWTLGSK